MSAKLMGSVWDLDLPHEEAWVLMAMVDHADHDGQNIFPRVRYIAWKTGYHERHVRRIVKKLTEKKILIAVEKPLGGTVKYRADFSRAPLKAPFQNDKGGMTFCQGCQNVSPDIAMSPITLNSYKDAPVGALDEECVVTSGVVPDSVAATHGQESRQPLNGPLSQEDTGVVRGYPSADDDGVWDEDRPHYKSYKRQCRKLDKAKAAQTSKTQGESHV